MIPVFPLQLPERLTEWPRTLDACAREVQVIMELNAQIVSDQGGVPPHAILFAPDGMHYVGMPPGPKTVWRAVQQAAVDALGAFAIAFIHEGYRLQAESARDLEAESRRYGSVKAHPERVEVVAAIFEHRDGSGMWAFPIVRAGGSARAGEIEKYLAEGEAQGGLFSGWVRARRDAN